MYKYQFTVFGNGNFPIDMLRYDGCYPAFAEASYNIRTARATRRVDLETYSDSTQWVPTVDRWVTFGWSVDPTMLRFNCETSSCALVATKKEQ